MKLSTLKVIANDGCASGDCPTIYRSKDNRIFVQGYLVPDIEGNLKPNEAVVEISEALLINLLNAEKEDKQC